MAEPAPGLFNRLSAPGASAVGGFNITPSDTVNFAKPTQAIFVGGGGTVTPVMLDGTTPQFTVPTGGYLYVQATRVNLTGTGATLLVGIY